MRRALCAARAEGARASALLALGYHFALRAGEYGRIRREHVHLAGDAGDVYVTAEKDSISRTQPLDVATAAALRDWLAVAPASQWLFPSARDSGLGVARGEINRIVARVWARAGLPRRAAYPHILKASRATHLLEAGAPLKAVQEWLRHKSAASTQRYLHLTSDARRSGEMAIARVSAALVGEPHASG